MVKSQLPLAASVGVGVAFILWLLLSSPDSELGGAECRPALTLTGTADVSYEDEMAAVSGDPSYTARALNVCSGEQNERLSWALLLSMPTGVAAGVLIARWGRDARSAEKSARRWIPPQSVIDERDREQGDKDR
ncbi:hypothetical protein [Streptomyces sp. NBC_01506]|uniref:hypothetical protein n=1 Tax=Streptomyces sp. NBC_01506 TaxID=2903887 RepID=UPI0038645203